MTDFHSHVLPGIDDGSAGVEESRQMLEESLRQGVSVLCATPHFYAMTDTLSSFSERREGALSAVSAVLPAGLTLLPGAEVYYFEGIGRSDVLADLTIKESPLLLLEMPFDRWSRRTVDEVCSLADSRRALPVLAHVDRYLRWEKKEDWYRLADRGVAMQVNAGAFLDRSAVRRLSWMLREGMIDVLGSDMHNMTSRKPNLREGAEAMTRRFGPSLLQDIASRSAALLPDPIKGMR